MNGEAGKGDKPRNLGKKFRENYDLINWGNKQKTPVISRREAQENKK